MFISTKGRYALTCMLDLAEHCKDGNVSLKDIAERQGISLKYLESIMKDMVSHGLVKGVHGWGGGYSLTRDTKDYTALEIVKAAEDNFATVSCLAEGSEPCDRITACRTIKLWKGLDDAVNEYLQSVTLAELLEDA